MDQNADCFSINVTYMPPTVTNLPISGIRVTNGFKLRIMIEWANPPSQYLVLWRKLQDKPKWSTTYEDHVPLSRKYCNTSVTESLMLNMIFIYLNFSSFPISPLLDACLLLTISSTSPTQASILSLLPVCILHQIQRTRSRFVREKILQEGH